MIFLREEALKHAEYYQEEKKVLYVVTNDDGKS
jgi:hypothetical protein